jgi:hypothetical protein
MDSKITIKKNASQVEVSQNKTTVNLTEFN